MSNMPLDRDDSTGSDEARGRLRTLFETALEQPAAQRQAWVQAQTMAPGERTALLRLLAANNKAIGALDTTVAERAARIGLDDAVQNEAGAPGLIGQQIGAFRLIRLLGQGGMATVFLGEREGADFAQQAAVKLLRRGLYSEVEQRLFRRERQTLARLSHPNIAHLIDGGVTATGIPYLVMEYIDGVSITEHMAAQRLDLRARLRLFAVVCLAVEAAHRQLIVHRDLKPSNILVDAYGEVKLLDFGIAKLLDDDDGATRTGIAALTPGYAAPEQYVGGPVSTATDVYSLGVLLHELLLGVRPEATTSRRPSALATGRDQEPGNLPAGKTALHTALKGDLDNILLKALAIEPARRYASAGAFADDIDRHLDGRPVAAHPPSHRYRTGKFVLRHKTGVAAAAAVMLSLVIGLTLTVWQAERAQRQAARATAVRDFVQTLFDPVSDGLAEGKMPSIRDLVTLGVQRLDATPGLGPAERVDLLTLFSRLHENIGEMQRAFQLAHAATDLAEARLDPLDPLAIQALATRGFVSTQLEDFVSAGTDLRLAHRRMQRIGMRGAPLIHLLDALATVENSEGKTERVLRLEQQALAERRATWGRHDGRLGPGHDNLGYALEGAARYDEAAVAWHQGYLVNLRHLGPDSSVTANSLHGEASSLWRAGHWRAAHARFIHTSNMLARIGGKPRFLHAIQAGKLCALEGGLANREAAALRCAEARRVTREAYTENHPIYADALVSSAIGLIEVGDLDAARAMLEQARGKYGNDSHDALRRGRLGSELAAIALLEHQPRLARPLLATAAVDLRSRAYWVLPLIAEARQLLACTQAPGAGCATGLEARLMARADDRATTAHPQLVVVDTILARVALQRGDPVIAASRLTASIQRSRRELRGDHPRILEARLWRALASANRGDCAAAAAEMAEVKALQRVAFPRGHPFLDAPSAGLGSTGQCLSSRRHPSRQARSAPIR